MKNGYLALVSILGVSGLAHSQSGPPLYRMADNPCPPQQSSGPTPAMIAAMMKPGAKRPELPKLSDEELQVRMKQRGEEQARDFSNLCRYKADNAKAAQGKHPHAVFMGDSITDFWKIGDAALFSEGVLDRGISGQTSPQMLARFYQDVIALRPTVVHIMAGTNDVAGNTGPTSTDDFKNNIRAMVDLAQANKIKVVLASILPADTFPWRTDLHPAEQIKQLNAWLRQFAAECKVEYADYYSTMTTESGAMKPALSNDGVHPNTDGYAVMRPITEAALRKAESRK